MSQIRRVEEPQTYINEGNIKENTSSIVRAREDVIPAIIEKKLALSQEQPPIGLQPVINTQANQVLTFTPTPIPRKIDYPDYNNFLISNFEEPQEVEDIKEKAVEPQKIEEFQIDENSQENDEDYENISSPVGLSTYRRGPVDLIKIDSPKKTIVQTSTLLKNYSSSPDPQIQMMTERRRRQYMWFIIVSILLFFFCLGVLTGLGFLIYYLVKRFA